MEAGNPTSPGTFAGSPAPGAAQGSTPQSGHTPRQTPLTPTQSVQGLPALTERVSRQERQLELMNEGIRRTEELLQRLLAGEGSRASAGVAATQPTAGGITGESVASAKPNPNQPKPKVRSNSLDEISPNVPGSSGPVETGPPPKPQGKSKPRGSPSSQQRSESEASQSTAAASSSAKSPPTRSDA
jgi:hypothetical protein